MGAQPLERHAIHDGVLVMDQAFAIIPKVREADRLMIPELQKRVLEGHREQSFRALNGGTALEHPKLSAGGMLQRLRLVQRAGLRDAAELAAERAGAGAQMDDVLDAVASARVI